MYIAVMVGLVQFFSIYMYTQASKRYLIVARSMKSYEDDLYTEWIETVEATLPDLLKRTVLCKPPPPLSRSLAQTPASSYASRPVSRVDHSHIVPPGTHNVIVSIILNM